MGNFYRLRLKRALIAGLCVAVASVMFLISAPHDADAKIDKVYRTTLQMTSGKADTVELPSSISDVLIASPSIADVGVLRQNRLYIVGRDVGDTNVLAFDNAGNVLAEITVHVRIDENNIKETIAKFFPDENVEIKTVGENIVLTGRVTTPAVANQVRDLVGRFRVQEDQEIVDLMKVAGEQQVMLKVKIIEADRSVLREIGVTADYQTDIGGSDFNSAFVNSVAGTGLTAANPFASGAIFFSDSDDFGPLSINAQALESDGLINTLAEPNLTAISGESAGFLAGGEFPVPTGVDNQGRIQIEFKQFGVSLDFRPIVLSKERISLQLSTEVSSLAEQDSVTLGAGIDIPGLTVRRARTTVEMSSGSSLMIAGLLQSETTNALNGLPGISNIPILGELFKSKSFARDETELIVMISPYLVNTFSEAVADVAEGDDAQEGPLSSNAPLQDQLNENVVALYGRDALRDDLDFGYIIE